jgi:hypothetical protein
MGHPSLCIKMMHMALLLNLFRVQDRQSYSSWVIKGGHMNHPPKEIAKMVVLIHLKSNSFMQPPTAPVG